jgi:predicted transcriptional regulator of viral defense system
VSDPTRTLIYILDEPKWGGGIRHVTHIIEAYWSSEHRDETLLIDYAKKLGNAAVVKRLGYLLETLQLGDEKRIDRLQRSITAGYARLEPSMAARGPFIARWNLQINVDVSK